MHVLGALIQPHLFVYSLAQCPAHSTIRLVTYHDANTEGFCATECMITLELQKHHKHFIYQMFIS